MEEPRARILSDSIPFSFGGEYFHSRLSSAPDRVWSAAEDVAALLGLLLLLLLHL